VNSAAAPAAAGGSMDACVAQTPQMARQHAAALLECEQLAQKILDGTQQNVLDVKQGLQLAPLHRGRSSASCQHCGRSQSASCARTLTVKMGRNVFVGLRHEGDHWSDAVCQQD